MFEAWVAKRKNANLREALLLRKAEKYTEAWAKLEQACAEGDGEAFYFKAHALWSGGWGQKACDGYHVLLEKAAEFGCWWPSFNKMRNVEDHNVLLIDKGNAFVCEFCLYSSDCFYEHTFYAATSGDARAQQMIARCGDGLYAKSAEQKQMSAIGHMATCFECGDVLTRAHYKILNGLTQQMEARIFFDTPVDDCSDEDLRLQELYMYGKEFASGNLCGLLPEETQDACQVYYLSWYAAQKTVLFWLLWTKKERLLCPDISRLIGKMVWETRTRPAEWGGRIDPYCKRQKK